MKRTPASTGLSGRQLQRMLQQLCERAQDDVTRLSAYEEAATHQLRVRMKKLLALLRLGRPGIEEQTLQTMRQHVRSIKNACACNRDCVVQNKLIDKLTRQFHLAPKHRPRMAASTTATPLPSHLRHQLHALRQLIDTTCIASLTTAQLFEEHARCYRNGRRLMKQSCETTNRDTLHRWRHRVKDLYFQTLALSHFPGAKRRVKRARRLGNLLGRDQDLANLARDPAFSLRRNPWREVIVEHRGRLRQRYLTLGHKLYAPPTTRFSDKLLCGA